MSSSSLPNCRNLLGTKRVQAEFKHISTLIERGELKQLSELSFVGDDVMRWRFQVKDFDDDLPGGKQLNNDLRELNRRHEMDHILMELSFPHAYPHEPFFLRVVRPRCKWYTGHVTAGGSICIQALTNGVHGGWQSDYSVESVLHVVLANAVDCERVLVRTATGPGGLSGPLRIDLYGEYCGDVMREYTESEARSAYSRMIQHHAQHGWGNDRQQPGTKVSHSTRLKHSGLSRPASIVLPPRSSRYQLRHVSSPTTRTKDPGKGQTPATQDLVQQDVFHTSASRPTAKDTGLSGSTLETSTSGTDFALVQQLLAAGVPVEEIAAYMGVDMVLASGPAGPSTSSHVPGVTAPSRNGYAGGRHPPGMGERSFHEEPEVIVISDDDDDPMCDDDAGGDLSDSLMDEEDLEEVPQEHDDQGPCLMTDVDMDKMNQMVEDCQSWLCDKDLPVLLEVVSLGKVHVTLHGLPRSVTDMMNMRGNSLTLRLKLSPQDDLTRPVVWALAPDLDGILQPVTLLSSSHWDHIIYHHLKALLSLIDGDLEIMTQVYESGGKTDEALNKLEQRISNRHEHLQSKGLEVFALREDLVAVDPGPLARQILDQLMSWSQFHSTGRPRGKAGYLCVVTHLIYHDVLHLTSRCFLCGGSHCHAIPTPQVCSNQLCRFRVSQTPRLAEVIPFVTRRPHVAELLICLAQSAAKSTRHADILQPVPVDFVVASQTAANYREISVALDCLPSVAEMSDCLTEGQLKDRLALEVDFDFEESGEEEDAALRDAHGPEADPEANYEARERRRREGKELVTKCNIKLYGLLWWVLTNIADYIEAVDREECLKYVDKNKHKPRNVAGLGASGRKAPGSYGAGGHVDLGLPQGSFFKVHSLSSVMSQRNQACARQHGCFVGFHGSALENWYSIMKHGLRTMSGTRFMLCGAAHGQGIYIGKDHHTSLEYSGGNSFRRAISNTPQAGSQPPPPPLQPPPPLWWYQDLSCMDVFVGAGCRWSLLHLPTSFHVVSLCEVVDTKECSDHGWCYVAKNAEMVSIKYLVASTGP